MYTKSRVASKTGRGLATFSTCSNMAHAINNLITIAVIMCATRWSVSYFGFTNKYAFFLKIPPISSFSSKDNLSHCLPHNNMPIKNWTWLAKTGVPRAIS